jgi:hypothetical protein
LEVVKTRIRNKLYANTELGAEISDMASAKSDTKRPPHLGVDIGAVVPNAVAVAEAKDKGTEKAADSQTETFTPNKYHRIFRKDRIRINSNLNIFQLEVARAKASKRLRVRFLLMKKSNRRTAG